MPLRGLISRFLAGEAAKSSERVRFLLPLGVFAAGEATAFERETFTGSALAGLTSTGSTFAGSSRLTITSSSPSCLISKAGTSSIFVLTSSFFFVSVIILAFPVGFPDLKMLLLTVEKV